MPLKAICYETSRLLLQLVGHYETDNWIRWAKGLIRQGMAYIVICGFYGYTVHQNATLGGLQQQQQQIFFIEIER